MQYSNLKYFCILTFLLNCMTYNVYATDDMDNIVDPMVPKTQMESIKDDNSTDDSELVTNKLQLEAIGHSEDGLYCVINDNILSIGDNILKYKIKNITDSSVLLIDLFGQQKILYLFSPDRR